MNKKTLHRFRMIGIAEGISFLVLLLIAMPLKYFLNFPQAVKYVGWLHGALFVAYIYFALTVFTVLKKLSKLASIYFFEENYCEIFVKY